jgi:hypothetical protein
MEQENKPKNFNAAFKNRGSCLSLHFVNNGFYKNYQHRLYCYNKALLKCSPCFTMR